MNTDTKQNPDPNRKHQTKSKSQHSTAFFSSEFYFAALET